jgi:hypothetical protein
VKRARKPHLITDAERSPEQELRSREIRYVVMMAIRAVCVIVAAVLVMTDAPLLPLWLTLCVAGALILPWTAVLLANDRAPKPEHRLVNRFRRPSEEPTTAPALPQQQHRVIDAED